MNNRHMLSGSVSLFLLAAVSTGNAADPQVADGSWKGDVELGIVTTTGNTETETINAKAKAVTEREKWRHTVSLESLNTSNGGDTTAERYVVNGQSDYKFGEHNYFFVMINYENARFSGYDYRVSEALGYGRRVIDKAALALDLEIGPGARQSKLSTGGNEDEFTLRGAAKLAWKVSDTSTFTTDLSVDAGEDTTVTKSVTALTAQINGSLATKITYTIKNTSDVPVGVEKTDTETAVTLVYSF
ncbi:MAG: DUF481 domain-containing protein [Gammaproteobacteria bacterium]|nr:DUF481 domain-containing protein [Gammaproteobacteria bacterium]MCF6260612.1 DUF481 domain-containing protein [Gammaproteobacteria bacterium]